MSATTTMLPESSSRNPSVLIVDPSADSREVLRLGLRRCGFDTLEAAGAEQGLAMIDQHHPQVVVLDVEPEALVTDLLQQAAGEDELVFDRYSHEAVQQDASLVVLGRTTPSARTKSAEQATGEGSAASQFFAKPYQYAAVIRKIEELVRQSPN